MAGEASFATFSSTPQNAVIFGMSCTCLASRFCAHFFALTNRTGSAARGAPRIAARRPTSSSASSRSTSLPLLLTWYRPPEHRGTSSSSSSSSACRLQPCSNSFWFFSIISRAVVKDMFPAGTLDSGSLRTVALAARSLSGSYESPLLHRHTRQKSQQCWGSLAAFYASRPSHKATSSWKYFSRRRRRQLCSEQNSTTACSSSSWRSTPQHRRAHPPTRFSSSSCLIVKAMLRLRLTPPHWPHASSRL